MPAAVSPGRAIGTMMRSRVRSGPAPSIIAASSISIGRLSKNDFKVQMQTGRVNTQFTRITRT